MATTVVRALGLAAWALAVPAAAAEPAAPKAGSQAVVRDVRGLARVKQGTAQTWTAIKKGDLLFAGDVVRVLDESRMQLMMRGGGLVTLGARAQIEISDPAAVRQTAQGGMKTRLKLIVGGLFARVHTEIGGPEFAIDTPSAVAAVKGCGFGLFVAPNHLTSLITTEGLVRFHNEHGAQDVNAGFQSNASPGQAPGNPAPFDPRQAPVWLGTVAGDGGEQTVKMTVTDADGKTHDVILKFKK